jgi:RHS repeat-associated protein
MYTTPSPVEMGFVNLPVGNLHIEIPLVTLPQRGSIPYTAKLIYDSLIWVSYYNGTSTVWSPTGVPNSTLGGWRFVTTGDAGTYTYGFSQDTCDDIHIEDYYGPFYWSSPDGTLHLFNIYTQFISTQCGGNSIQGGDAYATDGSGYHMHVSGYHVGTVYAKDGTIVRNPTTFFETKDTNGNYYTRGSDGNLVDNLGRKPFTVSSNGNQITYATTNSQGNTENYVVTTQTVNYYPYFTQSGITDVQGSFTAIQSIGLPDGTSYQFGYDSGTTLGHYGVLTSMTLPTGGTVQYGYTNFTNSSGSQSRFLNSRTSGGGSWSYVPATGATGCQSGTTNCQTVTATKPSGDVQKYWFSNSVWNTQITFNTGSSTLLKTVVTTRDFASTGLPTQVVETVAVPGGNLSTQTQYVYDNEATTANVTAKKEWNFYSGSPSANPDRETDTVYVTDTNYTSIYISNRPLTITTKPGGGTQVAQTTYTYDSTTIGSATGVFQHDDTGYGTGMTYRGNPTVMSKWVNGSTSLSETKYYDMTGQLTKLTDMNGNNTTYDYTDTFYEDTGANPPASYSPGVTTNAYLKSKTLPVIGAQTYGYYYFSGKQAMATDQNSAASYQHYQDPLDRITGTYGPTGSWTLTNYTSSTQQDTYASINDTTPSSSCTSCTHQMRAKDTLARLIEHAMMSDPCGVNQTDISYDTTSRRSNQTNPYCTSSNGSDTFTYDGVDRVTSTTHTDGNATHAYYGADVSSHGGASTQLCSSGTYGYGYPALFVDEAGKKRQVWQDAYKRAIELDEPDSGNSLTVGTCYKYDILNNLTSVVQGTETRSYSYDGIDRKTQETLPESGTTNYYYTTSGGAACSGDSNLVCRKTDARGTTITYSYDGLNRLTGKTYSDSTPSASISYDQTSYNGLTITNGKGRRTGMSDGSGTTAWSYDAAGNLLTEKRTIAGITKSTSYTYNLSNQVATITYPSGHTVTYTYDNAGHQSSVVDSGSSINYATSVTYDPSGALASAIHGYVSGGFAGITRTYSYNNRMQPSTMVVSSSNGTVQNLTYSYDLGSGVNNGNVASITNNLNTSRTQTFTYDYLNRLASAQSQATSGTYCWGETYTYDRWGNLYSRGTQKTGTGCTYEPLSLTVNGSNQLTGSGITYDSAGNLTNNGSLAFTWNAENELSTGGGSTYTYDGDGWRRKNTSGKLFWNDPGCSHPILMESDTSGNTPEEYIYLAGHRIAWRDSGTIHYFFDDYLGSTRLVTSATGTVQDDSDFYPFGGEIQVANSVDNRYKFTGKRRDSETSMDYSLYRMYNPAWGRWLEADPVHGKPNDPQTQNLYAYVRDNPSNLTDPLGNRIAPHFCSSVTGTVPSFGTILVNGFDFSSGSIDIPEPRCPDGAWDGLLAAVFPIITTSGPYNCVCEGINIQPIVNECLTNCSCMDTMPDRPVLFPFARLKAPPCNATLSCPRSLRATEYRETITFIITVEIGIYIPTKCLFIP